MENLDKPRECILFRWDANIVQSGPSACNYVKDQAKPDRPQMPVVPMTDGKPRVREPFTAPQLEVVSMSIRRRERKTKASFLILVWALFSPVDDRYKTWGVHANVSSGSLRSKNRLMSFDPLLQLNHLQEFYWYTLRNML